MSDTDNSPRPPEFGAWVRSDYTVIREATEAEEIAWLDRRDNGDATPVVVDGSEATWAEVRKGPWTHDGCGWVPSSRWR